jgi:hypothetical protein
MRREEEEEEGEGKRSSFKLAWRGQGGREIEKEK